MAPVNQGDQAFLLTKRDGGWASPVTSCADWFESLLPLTGCVVIVQTLNPSDLECKIWLAASFVRQFAQAPSCVAEAIWGVSWITLCQDC